MPEQGEGQPAGEAQGQQGGHPEQSEGSGQQIDSA
jgi:hypothetical protein